MLAQIQAEFPDDVRIIYRHFPLDSIHDKAILATQAAEAAGLQDRFWEMHSLLYGDFGAWSSLSVDDFKVWLNDHAASLDLDAAQFEADFASDEIVAASKATWEDGQAIGLPGTPFFVINDAPYQGPMDIQSIVSLIELNKIEERQYSDCPPMTIDPLKGYTATIETEKGNIVIELFPDVAPITVNNFAFLAAEGWFDNTTFHRVIAGFMAQGGDPTGSGMGGPGYAFVNETSDDVVFDREGLLAMANSGPDTNGSQFFITYGPAEHLNGGYTIFGEVIEGMDVVESITPRDPNQPGGVPGDLIISITVVEY
ncbi:MAG: peptidylprolyl isomerase [Chloroflexi bacterium]|nr:peptidylprolyl isomerase [Chloroflexota bacterium]